MMRAMRFNTSTIGKTKTVNHEGEAAYTLNPALELYAAVVTTALGDKFYESGDERLQRIRSLIGKNDPLFVAKLAVYAREQMYLRSVPLVLAVELAKVHSGTDLVSRTVGRVVQRADEITELLAYYQTANERSGTKKLNKLSKQVQKGLASAFNRFSEYNFAKYERDAAVKLKDALFLVHPKAKDDAQQAVFDRIAKGTLETPYTWETQLSEAGKEGKDKKAVWEELIASGKLGYMALLRNLRNMLEADVSAQALATVATRLADPDEVRKSKQFPFRFLSAYEELQSVVSPRTSVVLDALEGAMAASADNIEGFGPEASVFIASDVSGSMQGRTVSEKSKVRIVQVGLVLAMLLHRKCKAVMSGAFADHFKMFNLPKGGILANARAIDGLNLGGSTNGHLALQALLEQNAAVDKVMVFTDMQLWDSGRQDPYVSFGYSGGVFSAAQQGSFSTLWHEYKKRFPEAKLYLFDLAGYGNTPVSTMEKDVYFISGWSDRIFGVLSALERGSSALEVIEGIDL